MVTAAAVRLAFEQAGLRNTRPRRLIAEQLAELATDGQNFSSDDLWRTLQSVDPGLGRATVFRAVDILLARGVLDRVDFADNTHRYRVCGAEHHHHLTCTQCHRVVEVEACLPGDAFSSIANQTGFDLEGHSIELFGRCHDCKETAASA